MVSSKYIPMQIQVVGVCLLSSGVGGIPIQTNNSSPLFPVSALKQLASCNGDVHYQLSEPTLKTRPNVSNYGAIFGGRRKPSQHFSWLLANGHCIHSGRMWHLAELWHQFRPQKGKSALTKRVVAVNFLVSERTKFYFCGRGPDVKVRELILTLQLKAPECELEDHLKIPVC